MPDEWHSIASRFLFLEPAQDSVKTEFGSLLLDKEFAGNVYVKGIWITNMKEDNLASGVNLVEMELDRGRY